MTNKTVIIIAGPTAVGKTRFAIELAKKLNTSVISADSRQCFRELNIGVAKPSPQELEKVRHYFINSHSIHEPMNAVIYEQYSLDAVKEIFKHSDYAVMAGGTGLYIKAFAEGIDLIPDIDPAIRKALLDEYETSGIEKLQELVQKEDPLYYATGELKNPHRLIRALEVIRGTGKSIREYQSGKQKERPFRIIKFMLDEKRVVLYENINKRVDEMMNKGLLKEASSVIAYRDLPPLQTVGYTELFDYFDGNSTLEEAVELIKRNTRRYAKRQLTWFRKDPEFLPIPPTDSSLVLKQLGL